MSSQSAFGEGRSETAQRLTIAHLVTIPESADVLLRGEIEASIARGHRVIIYSGPQLGYRKTFAGDPQVTYVEVPTLTRSMNVSLDLKAFVELWRLFRRANIDVLHTHMPKTGWIGRVAGRVAGTPWVVNTCHGLYARQPPSKLMRLTAFALEWLSEPFADVNLFQNSEDLALLRRTAPWRKRQYIGNGIVPDRFCRDEQAGAELRDSLDIAQSDIVVGGVGRLIEHKGIREFEAVAERLGTRATFVWAGAEETEKATAIDVRGSTAVHFLGRQHDMVAFYSMLDLFVLPSYMEGVPRSAMEAASIGVPLILSDIPGCRDLGADGDGLRLVPPKDVDLLTASIEDFLNDPAESTSQALKMRQRVLDHHDQRVIAERLEAIYQSGPRRCACHK